MNDNWNALKNKFKISLTFQGWNFHGTSNFQDIIENKTNDFKMKFKLNYFICIFNIYICRIWDQKIEFCFQVCVFPLGISFWLFFKKSRSYLSFQAFEEPRSWSLSQNIKRWIWCDRETQDQYAVFFQHVISTIHNISNDRFSWYIT